MLKSSIVSLQVALFFCLTLSTGVVYSAELTTELGFRTVDSSAPANVAAAADSVFEIRMATEKSASDVRAIDLTNPAFANADERVDKMTFLDGLGKQVVHRQIANCRTRKIESMCPVMFSIEKATGFLVGGDGSYLITNAHVITRYLELLQSYSPGKSMEQIIQDQPHIPVFLFDRAGKLVFDPTEIRVDLVKTGVPSYQAKMQNKWFAEDSDYVVLHLGKVIGKPLKIGQRAQAGDQLTHIGYPACTGCELAPDKDDPLLNQRRPGGLDSSGDGLKWASPGPSISWLDAVSLLALPYGYASHFRSSDMIFFASDAQVGMSGGPILNSRGEAVGIFAGMKPWTNRSGSMTVLSRGVRPPEFDAVP